MREGRCRNANSARKTPIFKHNASKRNRNTKKGNDDDPGTEADLPLSSAIWNIQTY